jgi:uncharacterized membrane protein YgaE (UPF0421/DUF939 family)
MTQTELDQKEQRIINQMFGTMIVTCTATLIVSAFIDSPWMLLAYIGVIAANVLFGAIRIELAQGQFDLDNILADIEDY